MVGAEFSVSGIDEMLANLKNIQEKMLTKAENAALKAGGKVLAEAAKQKAPRSASPRQPKEGTKSAWRPGDHMADHIIVSNVKKEPDGTKYVEVGPQADYIWGYFWEYGTKKMPAAPFLYPALHENRVQILAAMADVIRGAMKL